VPLTAVAFWLLYVSGTAAAVAAPLIGVLLYVLVYHMNPGTQWWGESVRAAGLRPALTVTIAIVIGLAIRFPRFDGVGRQFSAPLVWGLLLTLYGLVSMSWGYGVNPRGIFVGTKVLKVMIFLMILVRCVRRPEHYQLVIIAWLAGVLYLGYQALGRVGVQEQGRLAYGVGGPDFAESSGLAVHLVATLPLIGAMFFMARRWWSRSLLLIVGALAVNTIVLTRTRNAIVGIAAVTLVTAPLLPRGHRLKGWFAIMIGAVLAFQLCDPGWWRRMTTISAYREDASAVRRLAYWRAAFEMSMDHPFGIGLGNFHEVVKEYVPGLKFRRSAHSTYFQCLADLGWPGFFLLAAMIGSVLGRLNRIQRLAEQHQPFVQMRILGRNGRFHIAWHAVGLRAALCGYLACGIFTTRLWAEGFWILVGLVCALENVTAYVLSRQRLPAEQRHGPLAWLEASAPGSSGSSLPLPAGPADPWAERPHVGPAP